VGIQNADANLFVDVVLAYVMAQIVFVIRARKFVGVQYIRNASFISKN
jgi:hypothetical protein